jgi:osmoprotectant transport system substrate-binding protein
VPGADCGSRRLLAVACCGLTVMLLASCSPRRTPLGSAAPPRAPVVVASFNFPESVLLGEIYSQALEHAGVPVRRELGLGPREMVLPALHQGLVDVVPEYLGSALAGVDSSTGVGGASLAEERARLAGTLRAWNVELLAPAPAANQNGLAVTAAIANRYHLRTISDLASVAPKLTLGGPSVCPRRPYCLVGFQSVYSVRFARFISFDAEEQRIAALEQGVVDVAVMFSTDGELATGNFVLLDDDRHLQPAENVTPLVSTRAIETYGARVVAALEAVSAKLTSPGLVFLNWRIGLGGKDITAEARGWLERLGMMARR